MAHPSAKRVAQSPVVGVSMRNLDTNLSLVSRFSNARLA